MPLGAELADDDPMAAYFAAPPGAGSVIAVVATDAPFLPGQCKALARRVTLGSPGRARPARTPPVTCSSRARRPTPGRSGRASHGQLSFVPWGKIDRFFTAVVQATEEAVINALVANEEMTGRAGHRVPALPRDRVARFVTNNANK